MNVKLHIVRNLQQSAKIGFVSLNFGRQDFLSPIVVRGWHLESLLVKYYVSDALQFLPKHASFIKLPSRPTKDISYVPKTLEKFQTSKIETYKLGKMFCQQCYYVIKVILCGSFKGTFLVSCYQAVFSLIMG